MAQGWGQFPSQIKYIVGNEGCERFSFYGMKSILVVYMVDHLKLRPEDSEAIYHLFVSLVYFLPLFGAYLADSIWGKYKTILVLSCVYCFGHLTLALTDGPIGLMAGLGLIAVGAGGIKPCISAFTGDQFVGESKKLIGKVYDLFYWSVNFGSFFATLLIPYTLSHWGANIAFGIPGGLMAIATFLFWLGRAQYVHVPLSSTKMLWNLDKKELKSVFELSKVFLLVSFFWALYDQNGSSWVLQAEKMEHQIFGMTFEPAQVQALNPIMILVMIPVFRIAVYPALARFGLAIQPLQKMFIGMCVAASSFVVMGIFQRLLDHHIHLSTLWQIIPYFLMSCAEVMVSVTGLEFAYTQAPKSLKSTVMSLWLLSLCLGNLLDAVVAELNIFEGATFFYFFALLMLGVAFIFQWFSKHYVKFGKSTS